MNKIAFGTTRSDRYMKAAVDLKTGLLVRTLKKPYWGVRPVKTNKDQPFIAGATVESARRGQGVWVRFFGPASVRMSARKESV